MELSIHYQICRVYRSALFIARKTACCALETDCSVHSQREAAVPDDAAALPAAEAAHRCAQQPAAALQSQLQDLERSAEQLRLQVHALEQEAERHRLQVSLPESHVRMSLASDNEKKIFAHGIYVMTSARGGSTTWFDETQEKVNGGIRKIVGKDYWEGKQKLIALAALRLADFQQCRRQNAHGFTCAPKETVTRAGARSIGAERNSTLSLSDAFWGPLRAWRDSKIWAVGGHIIKGKPHQRGSLITLAGQPMNPKFLALLDVAEERQSALAQKVGLERTWRHEIGLRTVESDAGKDRDSSAKEWCRAYSTSDTDIEKGWIVADLQAELGRLREEWPTRRGRDGSAIVAPTIPAVLGGAPGAKEWFGKALTHWTDAKLKKTTKKILVAMLAAARERLVTTGALVPPPCPQEAASASSACDPTVLRQQMDRHVMLQAMPSWEQIDERRGASGAGSSGRSALGKRRAETLASAVEQHD